MKKATRKSTVQISYFLDRLKDESVLEINVPDHPVLLIQRGLPVRCSKGQGQCLSIGLIHDSGKKKYEFQMEFIVVDGRTHPKDFRELRVYPISFRDDINQVTQSACLIINGTVEQVLTKFQLKLVIEAEQWLNELATAGYRPARG